MPAQKKFSNSDFVALDTCEFFTKNKGNIITDCQHININLDNPTQFSLPDTSEYFDPRTLVQPDGIDLSRTVLFVDSTQTNKYDELLECKYTFKATDGVEHIRFQPLPASTDPISSNVKLHLAFADLNAETIDKEWLLTISNIAKLLGAPSNTSYPLEHANWMKNFISKPLSLTRFFFRMATLYLGTMMADMDIVEFTPRHHNVFASIGTPIEHQMLIDIVRKSANDVFWLPSGFSHKRSALSVLALLASPKSSFTGIIGSLWPEMNSPIVAYSAKETYHQDIENDNVTSGMIYSVISTLIAYYDAREQFNEILRTVAFLAMRPDDGKAYCFSSDLSILSLPISDMRAQVLGPIIAGGPDAFVDYSAAYDARRLLIEAAYRRTLLSPCMAMAAELTGAHLHSITKSGSHSFKAYTANLMYKNGTVLMQTTAQIAKELGYENAIGFGLKYWEPIHSRNDQNIINALTKWKRYYSWQLLATMGFKTPMYAAGHSFITPLIVDNPLSVQRIWGKMDFITAHQSIGYITNQLPGTVIAYWIADKNGMRIAEINTSDFDNNSYSPNYPTTIQQVGKNMKLVVLPTTVDILIEFNSRAIHKRQSTLVVLGRDNYNCMSSNILDNSNIPPADMPSTLVEYLDKENFEKPADHQMINSLTNTGQVDIKMSVVQDELKKSKLLHDPMVAEFVDAYCSATFSSRGKIDKEWPIYHQLIRRLPQLLQTLPLEERNAELKRFMYTSKSLAKSAAHLDKEVVAADCDYMFTLERSMNINPGLTFSEVQQYAKKTGSLLGNTTFAKTPKDTEIVDILSKGQSIIEWLLLNNQGAKLGMPTSKKNAIKQENLVREKKALASERLKERIQSFKGKEKERENNETEIMSSIGEERNKKETNDDPNKSDFHLAHGALESASPSGNAIAGPSKTPETSIIITEIKDTQQ